MSSSKTSLRSPHFGTASRFESIKERNSDSESESDSDLDLDKDKEIPTATNQSIIEYENMCASFQLLPCKIVLKSLPTTSLVLSNYGLSATALYALTQALKVRMLFKKNSKNIRLYLSKYK